MDTKTRPVYMLSTRDTLQNWDTYKLKVRRWKKIFHANGYQKKAGVAILISHKIGFKTKTITRDKEGHYIMIKGSIQEEDIHRLALKGENNSNTNIVRDIKTPLSPMDRSSEMKINKEPQALNDTLNKMDLIDIYRAFHPKTTE